jgi:hypothetical protein
MSCGVPGRFFIFSETRRVADFPNCTRGVSDMAQSLSKQIKGQIVPEGKLVDTSEDDECNSIIDHVESAMA